MRSDAGEVLEEWVVDCDRLACFFLNNIPEYHSHGQNPGLDHLMH